MILTVWDNGGKTADRYTVRIRNDYYAMSEDANMPNGVCMYIGAYGEVKESRTWGRKVPDGIQYRALPEGLRRAICERT